MLGFDPIAYNPIAYTGVNYAYTVTGQAFSAAVSSVTVRVSRTLSVSGQTLTLNVSPILSTAASTAALTSQTLISALNSAAYSSANSIPVTGGAINTALLSVNIFIDGATLVTVFSQQLAATLHAPAAYFGSTVPVTSQAILSALNDVMATIGCVVTAENGTINSEIKNVAIDSTTLLSVLSQYLTAAANTPTIHFSNTVPVTSQAILSALNDVMATIGCVVTAENGTINSELTSAQAIASAHIATLWFKLFAGQTGVTLTTEQDLSIIGQTLYTAAHSPRFWRHVDEAQPETSAWTAVPLADTPQWAEINTDTTTTWDTIET